MRGLFHPDSPPMKALSFVADVMILNLLFLLGCLPLVSIGASMAAMYHVAMKLVAKREGSLTKDFFRAWKGSFFKGLILELIFAVAFFLIWTGLEVLRENAANFSWIFSAFYLLAAFLVLMVNAWSWPLEASFVNRVSTTLKNAFLLGVANIGKSIVVVIINLIPLLLLTFAPDIFLATGIVWALFGFSAIAVINSILFHKVLKRYMEEEAPEEDPDQKTEETKAENL